MRRWHWSSRRRGCAAADVIKLGFGLPDADPAPVSARLVALTVGAAIALIFWGYLRWETVRDGDFGRESGRAANWRRAYFYLAAFAGSTLAILGAGESVRRLILALTNSSARGENWQVFLANCLAALIYRRAAGVCCVGHGEPAGAQHTRA